MRKLEELRCGHQNDCATVIQTKSRSLVARRDSVAMVSSVVKIQSFIRRFNAEHYLGRLIRGKWSAKLFDQKLIVVPTHTSLLRPSRRNLLPIGYQKQYV